MHSFRYTIVVMHSWTFRPRYSIFELRYSSYDGYHVIVVIDSLWRHGRHELVISHCPHAIVATLSSLYLSSSLYNRNPIVATLSSSYLLHCSVTSLLFRRLWSSLRRLHALIAMPSWSWVTLSSECHVCPIPETIPLAYARSNENL